MNIKGNPYTTGGPVGENLSFYGREDVILEIKRILKSKDLSVITLFGQRRIGKTSLLQYLTKRLPEEGNYHTVYYDLQDKADWPLALILKDLAKTVAYRLGMQTPDLGNRVEIDFYEKWLPTILNDIGEDHILVLLFDEFDVLADNRTDNTELAKSFIPYLRTITNLYKDRLKFIFTIGKNIEDLNSIALSLFKSVQRERVSLLTRENTEKLILLAEENGSLHWSKDAINQVWNLTHGHPFLTQALCWQIWEQAYESEPDEIPIIEASDVDEAVWKTLDAHENALAWLWDGLGSAEQVVISALAQAGPTPVSEARLEEILRDSGIQLIIRQLRESPLLLQEWDIIEPFEQGYRFRVELIRRWVQERRRLSRVQRDLDRILPAAENLYQAASDYYLKEEDEKAIPRLLEALELNPHHLGASTLLTQIYIKERKWEDAQRILEPLLEIYPKDVIPSLVQVYLGLADIENDVQKKIHYLDLVLKLSPDNLDALTRKEIAVNNVVLINSTEEKKQETQNGDAEETKNTYLRLYKKIRLAFAKTTILPVFLFILLLVVLLLYRNIIGSLLSPAIPTDDPAKAFIATRTMQQVLSTTVSPSAYITITPKTTNITASTSTSTVAPSPTSTATSTPTKTVFPKLPVSIGTRMPEPEEVINEKNVYGLVKWAVWDGVYDGRDWQQVTEERGAITQDGLIWATASKGEIQLYNARDGTLIQTLPEYTEDVCALEFSPDSHFLASGYDDGTINLWSVSDATLLSSVKPFNKEVVSLEFSPDSRFLASGSTIDINSVYIWNVTNDDLTLEQRIRLDYGTVYDVEFSPDGSQFATGGGSHYLQVRQTNDWTFGYEFPSGVVFDIEFSPDGLFLAQTQQNGRIRVWQNIDEAGEPREIEVNPSLSWYSIAYSLNGDLLFVTDMKMPGQEIIIRVFSTKDLYSRSIIHEFYTDVHSINRMDLIANGKILAISSTGKLELWAVKK